VQEGARARGARRLVLVRGPCMGAQWRWPGLQRALQPHTQAAHLATPMHACPCPPPPPGPRQDAYPDARRLIDAGEIVPDTLVADLLLEALLLDEPGLQDDLGFVVDGFPRTAVQVRCCVCVWGGGGGGVGRGRGGTAGACRALAVASQRAVRHQAAHHTHHTISRCIARDANPPTLS
jgi:hypothetical protein